MSSIRDPETSTYEQERKLLADTSEANASEAKPSTQGESSARESGRGVAEKDGTPETKPPPGEVEAEPANAVVLPPPRRLQTVKMIDHSIFHGEVTEDGVPHGVGILYSGLGQGRYSGQVRGGKKHGLGVLLQPNGGMFAGEWKEGSADGYGVKHTAFGDRQVGEWKDNELHGVGMEVNADGDVVWGVFVTGELDRSIHAEWTDTTQHQLLRAFCREQQALRMQELARQLEKDVFLREAVAISTKSFRSVDEVLVFDEQEEQALQEFLTQQRELLAQVQRDADNWKFREAQLKDRQKVLRAEITDKRNELSFVAKYAALADRRQEQLEDAERTLAMLQQQIQILQAKVDESMLQLARSDDQALSRMFVRPEGIHSGHWFGAGDHKDVRVALLLRKIRDFDIVILQEMFEIGSRQRRFVRAASELGFRYHAGSVWPMMTDRYLIDGGLLILSRYPIVERGQHIYSKGAGADGICAKGVLYARVQLSPDLSDSLHVFTTHTQAGDRLPEYRIRAAQLQELRAFIARTTQDDPHAPVLITGDFNLDARHNLTHDAATGDATATPCEESAVYEQLMSDLRSVLADGHQLVDLMKQHDSTKLAGCVHPITNGDGHATLHHKSDPLSPEKDGKCIDYIFFSPGVRERRSVSGDIPSLHLRVVGERSQVDHGDVAPLVRDEQEASTLEITHLSDHYGLRAELELEISPVRRPDGSIPSPKERLCETLQHHFPPSAFQQKTSYSWQWKVRVVLLLLVLLGTSVGVTAFKAIVWGVFLS
ncbi:hypothetical protein ATCC90586_001782 [Pythium insidiosum]|nr:hypothetical protein ATCC90586_001782 [Pythium insidiosum]